MIHVDIVIGRSVHTGVLGVQHEGAWYVLDSEVIRIRRDIVHFP